MSTVRRLRARLSWIPFLRSESAPAEAQPDDMANKVAADPPKAPGAPGVDRTANATQLRDGMAAIREHLRTFGAALAALATAVLAGLGYATLHKLFPAPTGYPGWWLAATGLAVAAVGGSVWLTSQFFAAQRRIVFTPARISPPERADPPRWRRVGGLTRGERELLELVLHEHAAEENAASARALEGRALRLARVARDRELSGRVIAKQAPPVQAEADRLDGVLAIAALRASLAVLEERSRRVFSPGWPLVALVVASVGIVGLFIMADYSQGQRDLVTLRADCTSAVKAGATTACDSVDIGTPLATVAPSSMATADVEVLARLTACAKEAAVTEQSDVVIPPALVSAAISTCAGLPTDLRTVPPTPLSTPP